MSVVADQTPPPHEIVAPAAWGCIDFISDLHLAQDTPKAFEAWRDYLLGTAADAVFILGDLFEAWVGDDARHEGLEAHGAAVLREASGLRRIGFMVGNRDFLLGREMLEACGIDGLPDPSVVVAFGQRVLLTHGDAWCLADVEYQRTRRVVRDPAWQAQVLARPLAERRALARSLRSESERKSDELRASGMTDGFDIDAALARQQMDAAGAAVLVHGHTHRPASESLGGDRIRHVLSDWELDRGVSPRADVLRWSASGWQRLNPTDRAIATRA